MRKRKSNAESEIGSRFQSSWTAIFLGLPIRLGMLAILLVTGCSLVSGNGSPGWRAEGERRVWPDPPAPARIEYVGAIANGTDLGRKPGWADRILSVIFGDRPTSMIRPAAVAKNGSGMLVVSDPGVPTVHFFDLEQYRYTRLEDAEQERLASPVGVAIAEDGRVYVADSVRARVFVIEDEKIVGEIGAGELQRPSGIALSPDQRRLYVADTLANQVFIFEATGRLEGRFGVRGVLPGEFNAPTFVATTATGEVVVSDSLNFRVQIFGPEGMLRRHFGGPGDGAGDFARPKGVGVDSHGRVYVVDSAFDNVQVFDPKGPLLLAFGRAGGGPGEFSLPVGLFVDATDTIWIADGFNQRVQVFRIITAAQ